ncbi:AraC family transcriptional regulator [Alkalihalophilus pseudofirmus]|uniref:AraC family transcriptional regulator n=1 Tax=Alkalihalophilus pseudofirmus TaxID=79885 RepID=A0AAJ2KTK6_ALKPS|nr:AraC family transcriptional regulator [Alkalihalophilus pseudofirmus]MDV2884772.1 AraC family transcriptional regulator [Alkalihalophilus pseudofirmus]
MLKRMNDAIDYIENRLNDELEPQELEKITGTSIYHFRRMFSYLSGMTLGTYIRNRRLSMAMAELLRENVSVTETAFKYGYDSVDGFTRAFKEWAGFTPSEVKKHESYKLQAFPKLSFQLTIQGGIKMEYKIVNKNAFKIAGVKKRVPIQFEGVNKEIEKLAESITNKQYEKMNELKNMDPYQVMNASYKFDEGRSEEKGYLEHMIGVPTTKEGPYDDLELLEVASNTWAIFSSKGRFPKTMQDTWAKIASEWLPSSNYELVDAPELSFVEDYSDLDNVYSEIWIAVKKKTAL